LRASPARRGRTEFGGLGGCGRLQRQRAVGVLTAAAGDCPETATKLPGGGHEGCPLAVMRSARHEFVCLTASRG